jgi:intein/homing endonuclease
LPIEEIEDSGKQRVYDMTIPGSHSFLANAIVTHNSFDIQRDLRSVGINSETLSVAKKHYEDFAMLVYEERVAAPHIDLLLEELLELRIMANNRVDHPRKKSKDLADAMCGSVYNAISHGKRETSNEIEIHTWDMVKANNIKKEVEERREIPEDIKQFLVNANIL